MAKHWNNKDKDEIIYIYQFFMPGFKSFLKDYRFE